MKVLHQTSSFSTFSRETSVFCYCGSQTVYNFSLIKNFIISALKCSCTHPSVLSHYSSSVMSILFKYNGRTSRVNVRSCIARATLW